MSYGSSLITATAVADALFCSEVDALYGPYTRLDDGTELLAGRLFRFDLSDRADAHVRLQLFFGLSGIGGQLWEQEARVLLRVSAIGHPALPRILNAGYHDEHDVAFVITEAAEFTLESAEGMAYFRSRPQDALRQLGMLADALEVLHSQGLMHRNVWPGSIDAVSESSADDAAVRLRLARFEMSSLISNIFRRMHLGEVEGAEEIRRLQASQGRSALAYSPPERLEFMASAGTGSFETDRSDVYGLGMLAWEWFVAPLPEELLRAAAATPPDPAWGDRRQAHLTGEITRRKLPRRLLNLLTAMLDRDPRTRLTSAELVRQLTENYDALAGWFDPSGQGLPHLVAFMGQESGPTVRAWKWIEQDPATDAGITELKHFLVGELRGAELAYSPDGAVPYVGGGERAAKARAKYVLIGGVGVWFCQVYEARSPFGGASEPLPEVLLIKYPIQKARAGKLLKEVRFRRTVSSVDLVEWKAPRRQIDQLRKQPGRPSWDALLAAVRVDRPRTDWELTVARAVDWFLELQQVELQAREYPYTREPTDTPGRILLRYHRPRDDDRITDARSGLFSLYAADPRRRPAFGDFFADATSDEGATRVTLTPDDGGRSATEPRVRAYVVARLDADLIEVRPEDGRPVPLVGWVRPEDDAGAWSGIRRQREVQAEFVESRSLLAQLHDPATIRGFSRRWEDAGAGLSGGAGAIVREVLASQAFYALHGPPGTGKTTVTAHVVAAFLRAEPGARVLISAQSHFALDNLAVGVLRQFKAQGVDAISVRVASRKGEEKVRDEVAPYKLDNLVLATAAAVAARAGRRLDQQTDPVPVRAVLGDWKRALETSHLELYDRLRRGANVVFATCATATKRYVDAVGSFGVYDWVIIEEAAKAWPTEIAIPLVRGVRWALVGDHLQLPAHRRREVEEVLAACDQPDLPAELQQHGKARQEYRRVFDVFGGLFERPDTGVRGLTRPLGRLKRQFRMRREIAEVVSRAFYPDRDATEREGRPVGSLETDPKANVDSGVTHPPALNGRALVWLDTDGVADCGNEGCWSNPGEARIVSGLLARMRPDPRELADETDEPLAVLTPYREQIDRLRRTDLPGWVIPRLFSVHEFQGREANVVVASLVRDKGYGHTPVQQLGHLASPEVVNVLFSRARHLLVVVGRFRHFLESGVDFWRVVCETVREQGVVVPAGDVVPPEGRRP